MGHKLFGSVPVNPHAEKYTCPGTVKTYMQSQAHIGFRKPGDDRKEKCRLADLGLEVTSVACVQAEPSRIQEAFEDY